MQTEIPPEPIETPRTAEPDAAQIALASETEADARIARLIAKRLNEAARRSLRAERGYVGCSLLMIACAMTGVITLPFFFDTRDPLLNALGYAFFGLQFILPVLTYGLWLAVKPKFDAQEIVELGGVKAITPLIALLQNTLPPHQEQAVFALLVLLLPRLKVSDAGLLKPADRNAIHSWLRRGNEKVFSRRSPDALCLAALKALEQVGDAAAIPAVERLTQIHPRNQSEQRLRQAATECLPMLRANHGNVESARMLLRASHSVADPPHLLLRSARSPNDAAPQELLRVASEPLPKPAPPPVSD